MPTNSYVPVTPGTGKNLSTYSINEDAINKELQRAVLNTSAGVEFGTAAAPIIVQGTVASGSTSTMFPVIGGMVTAVTPSAYADGKAATLRGDGSGNLYITQGSLLWGEDSTNNLLQIMSKPLPVSTYCLSTDNQRTRVTKRASKASAGNVFAIHVSNENAAARYFQLHNKASAPAGADVQVESWMIPAGTATNPGVLTIGKDYFGEAGMNFATGVAWAVSTTYDTFTDSATAAEHTVHVKYI